LRFKGLVGTALKDWVADRRGLAAGLLGAAALGLLALTLGSGSGGGARGSQLTVDVPPAAASRVYGAPGTAGRPIVVIDAGHGGRDPGATGVSGDVAEKQLTLAFAQELRDTLVERGRLRVALTREDDRYLTLEERAGVARALDAGLFVSLHTDSAPNPLARGASVYSLSDVASDAEAARFAAKENRGLAVDQGDGSVDAILADLASRSEMGASADFAARLVRKSAGRFQLRPEPHKFAAFHVLRRAETPAVLYEAGYISNVEDEALLRDPRHRKEIVLALAQAIEADIAAQARR
jgi:N-acetylmuramoyl-L-alanine amidase